MISNNKILIGFDFSINKPAATILYNSNYYHYFWPLCITDKQELQYKDANVFVTNRKMESIHNNKKVKNSLLVLIHTIRSIDLANLIISDIDNFINNLNIDNYELYICSEGLSYASKGDATLNLATYKGVLLAKLYEHYNTSLKRLYTYSPITLKATADCANKEDRHDKNKMIKKYIILNNNIKLRLLLANNLMISKTNYIPGIDDIVDSYWALQTMIKKEKI